MIRGIHHVGVHVRDLDRMIRFYREAFGFELVGEPFGWRDNAFIDSIVDVPNSAARGADVARGHLLSRNVPVQPAGARLRPTAATLRQGLHAFLRGRDGHRGGVQRLKALGMTFSQPAPIDVGHVKTIYGRDPEGNLIEIQQTAEHCDFPLHGLPPVIR
jgi:glyoxylase I family protein